MFVSVMYCLCLMFECFVKVFFGSDFGVVEATLLCDFMVFCLCVIEGCIDLID